jgi:hypothetical protein
MDKVKLEHFGSAKKIAVDMNMTHIVGGSGDQNLIDERILEV